MRKRGRLVLGALLASLVLTNLGHTADAADAAPTGASASPPHGPGEPRAARTDAGERAGERADERVRDERVRDERDDTPPTAAQLAFSRARYERTLAELHRTRAARKQESVEGAAYEYKRILLEPGFDDEMRRFGDRMARLRRIGNLLVAEGRPYALQLRVYALITREHARHDDAVAALEARTAERTGAGAP